MGELRYPAQEAGEELYKEINGEIVEVWNVAEVARYLDVHPDTVRSWARQKLIPVALDSSGARWFEVEIVKAWAAAVGQVRR